MNPRDKSSSLWSKLIAVGPAIIVASVVLGPGSILTNSRVGWKFGYEAVWVLVLACLLMAGMTALSARIGVFLDATPCEELSRRAGRLIAVLTGGSLFLVAASFQSSNNLGLLFALEPYLESTDEDSLQYWPVIVLLCFNAAIIAAVFGFRHLYRPVEWFMKCLVALMVLGFAANLALARPSLWSTFSGLVPRWSTFGGGDGSQAEIFALLGLVATTFSVGGAFYQAYLVRQKGWTKDDLGQGLVDSFTGIGVLCLMSLMIMITAAAVLHGNSDVQELSTAADVAKQLEPFFGPVATGLFCVGIFAGAVSSFLVNAMIGGTVLADGLGKGGSMDDLWPRLCTVAALLFGMFVAIGVKTAGLNTGKLIIFAQAITVLGNPLLAGALLWLALRPELRRQRAVPLWMYLLAGAGFIAVVGLSIRTVLRLTSQS